VPSSALSTIRTASTRNTTPCRSRSSSPWCRGCSRRSGSRSTWPEPCFPVAAPKRSVGARREKRKPRWRG
jgi:hypothetical protein